MSCDTDNRHYHLRLLIWYNGITCVPYCVWEVPEVPLSGGDVGAVVPALVVSVAGQAAASSSAHLPLTEESRPPRHGQEDEAEEDGDGVGVHGVNILTTVRALLMLRQHSPGPPHTPPVNCEHKDTSAVVNKPRALSTLLKSQTVAVSRCHCIALSLDKLYKNVRMIWFTPAVATTIYCIETWSFSTKCLEFWCLHWLCCC